MAISCGDMAAEYVIRRLSGELPKPTPIDTTKLKKSDAVKKDRPLVAYKMAKTVDSRRYKSSSRSL